MNKAHRVIWNQTRNCFVVAGEKTSAKGKPSTTRTAPSTPLRKGIAAAVAALFLAPGIASAGTTPVNTALTAPQSYTDQDITITNSGSITTTTANSAVYVSLAAPYTSTFTNNGTISATYLVASSATRYGVNFDNGIDVTGKLTNAGNITVDVHTTSAIAKAYGIYIGGGMADTLTNSGTIDASARGQASAYAYGIYVNNDLSGSLNNSGSISATANATSRTASAYGVYIASNLDGTLTNNGTISASAIAQTSAFVSAIGIYVGAITGTGTLTNTGTISAVANGAAGYATGVYVSTLDGILKNSGTIRATGLGGISDSNVYSIYASGGSGTINNQTGGLLDGQLYAGGIINIVNVVNDGTLSTRLNQSSVGGNYTQGVTGVLEIAVNATHVNYGSLSVGGTATLAAGTGIRVNADPAHGLVATDVLSSVISATTLTCSTTANCSAIKVQDNILALNFTASKNVNNLDLTAVASSLTTIAAATSTAGSSSAAGAAAVLDSLMGTINSQPKELGNFLYDLGASSTANEVANKVSQALPIVSLSQVTAGNLRGVNRVVQARMEQNRGLSSGDDFAGNRKVWIKPLGSWADQKDRNGAFGYYAKTYGVALGADSDLSQTSSLGAAFAYSHSMVDSNSGTQTAGINSYQLVLYGTRSLNESTEINWQADYGYNQNKGNRRIGGLTALSDYTSDSFHVGAGIGRTMAMSEQTSFTPSFRADYTSIRNNGYSETGAGGLNLVVNGKTAEELILAVDGKVARALSDTSTLIANLGVGYDVNARQNSVTAAFSGGGAAFTTNGINPPPTLARGGLGYVSKTAGGMEITARYDIEERSGFTGQTASVKFRMPF